MDSDTDSDLDCKPNGYIVLSRTFHTARSPIAIPILVPTTGMGSEKESRCVNVYKPSGESSSFSGDTSISAFFTEYLLYFQRALAAAAAPDTPREFAAIVADNLNESHLQEAENLGITLAEKMLSSGKGSDCLEKPKNLGVEGLILSFNT